MLNELLDTSAPDYPCQMTDSIESTLLSALIYCQPNTLSDEIRHIGPIPAPRHVKLAEQYVLEHPNKDLSTAVLASHANVSIRALFDGFRAFRNTTPAAFVRSVRLDRARADLVEGASTVTEISRRWGFGHPGNFSKQYYQRFGEYPLSTRRSLLSR
jgi:AraC-like DNA-binding protein